jgi:hypothetical protein
MLATAFSSFGNKKTPSASPEVITDHSAALSGGSMYNILPAAREVVRRPSYSRA